MELEISCGAVVFTKVNGKIKYVIIESKAGFYGFPKGHMEKGETEVETALREVKEEVGLDITLIDGFKTYSEYINSRTGSLKGVYYFVGYYENQDIKIQEEELNNACLMDFDEAYNILQFDNAKEVFIKAKEFIDKL